jgi:hypothetical protein
MIKNNLFLALTSFLWACNEPPNLKELQKPQKTEEYPKPDCAKIFTFLTGKNNKVTYYVCPETSQINSMDFSTEGMLQLISNRQNVLDSLNNGQLTVLLKVSPDAVFKNLEVAIVSLQKSKIKFAVVDLDAVDSTILQIKKKY